MVYEKLTQLEAMATLFYPIAVQNQPFDIRKPTHSQKLFALR